MIILATAARYVVLIFYYTEQCFDVLVYQAPNPNLMLGKPHIVGAFEDCVR